MVRLYIVRHGEANYSATNGGTLTQHGREEAMALAPYISEMGITHAYTSPLGRASLTAKLALQQTPKFSSSEFISSTDSPGNTASTSTGESKPKLSNFEKNVSTEDWCREIIPWRKQWREKFGEGWCSVAKDNKGRAIVDLPATQSRNALTSTVEGSSQSVRGWQHTCPDHAAYSGNFAKFCADADEFLSRHGIHRDGANYRMNPEDVADAEKRNARIIIFSHGAQALTLLSHLLAIPFPIIHSAMWLAPSSVTTIVFEEYKGIEADGIPMGGPYDPNGFASSTDNGSLVLTPRALAIGSTNHLAVQPGMDIYAPGKDAAKRDTKKRRITGIRSNFF
mmetsp:Transcript_5792/g.8409  ORF Transcript_5792/g.8409 Transcript_5792/m.8409 type:complete len:337 (+) Transcript_5792:309-1319(+)